MSECSNYDTNHTAGQGQAWETAFSGLHKTNYASASEVAILLPPQDLAASVTCCSSPLSSALLLEQSVRAGVERQAGPGQARAPRASMFLFSADASIWLRRQDPVTAPGPW